MATNHDSGKLIDEFIEEMKDFSIQELLEERAKTGAYHVDEACRRLIERKSKSPKVIMEGAVDCIMHTGQKEITPSSETPAEVLDRFPKRADVGYSKLWAILDGSDPEDPLWVEVVRPMIPSCEWKGTSEEIHSGDRIRITMQILQAEGSQYGHE